MPTPPLNLLESHSSVEAPERVWQALFGGQYRIVAWRDHDGRRELVVRPHGKPAGVFTPRQRRMLAARARGTALKVIALDHGLSTGSVSRLLTLALQRLGLATASDLAAVCGLSGGDASGAVADDLPPAPAGLTVVADEADEAEAELGLVLSFPLERRLPDNLTPAERDVVTAILAGLPTRRIAERRGVSPRTVSNQIAHIFGKLRVGSRLSLALHVHAASATATRGGVRRAPHGEAPTASRVFA